MERPTEQSLGRVVSPPQSYLQVKDDHNVGQVLEQTGQESVLEDNSVPVQGIQSISKRIVDITTPRIYFTTDIYPQSWWLTEPNRPGLLKAGGPVSPNLESPEPLWHSRLRFGAEHAIHVLEAASCAAGSGQAVVDRGRASSQQS